MVYELLKKVIEQQNAFMTTELIQLQIEFFYTAGRIGDVQRNELTAKLTPPEVPPETPPEG
jgi:hypothetical protein